MEKVLLAQLIAHLTADFFAQPECFVRGKQTGFLKSRHIYLHALIVFAASLALTFTAGFVLWAAIIAVSHFCVDICKTALERRFSLREKAPGKSMLLFSTDQIVHFIVIWAAVRIYWATGGHVPTYVDMLTTRALLVGAGFLLCLKPANVFIRVCLCRLGTIRESMENESLQRAGRWIGSMERSLAFVLVLLGQYTAIGFIIAAKSVLRYGDKTNKTEYVLIGTLLSFGVAFALGVGITSGVFESIINVICLK